VHIGLTLHLNHAGRCTNPADLQRYRQMKVNLDDSRFISTSLERHIDVLIHLRIHEHRLRLTILVSNAKIGVQSCANVCSRK